MCANEVRIALAEELSQMSAAMSACILSQDLFTEFVDDELPDKRQDFINISEFLKEILKVNKQASSVNLFAAFTDTIESAECKLFKEAVLGSRGSLMNRMAGDVKLGLVHNDSSLMIQYLQAFPEVERNLIDCLMDRSKPYNEILKEASRLWSLHHPLDDEYPPHPCEFTPPPPPPDEEKVQKIHRLNLTLHYAKEDWEDLLILRDEMVTTFGDYLEEQAGSSDGIAARLQQLVWMFQNCVTLFNPRLTPIQIYETIGSRLRICSEQTQVFISEIEAEQLKRSTGAPGLWSRLVSVVYRSKKHAPHKKTESDHAFDKLSAAYLEQAQQLLHYCVQFNGRLEKKKPGAQFFIPAATSPVDSSPPLLVNPTPVDDSNKQPDTPVTSNLAPPSLSTTIGFRDSIGHIPIAR